MGRKCSHDTTVLNFCMDVRGFFKFFCFHDQFLTALFRFSTILRLMKMFNNPLFHRMSTTRTYWVLDNALRVVELDLKHFLPHFLSLQCHSTCFFQEHGVIIVGFFAVQIYILLNRHMYTFTTGIGALEQFYDSKSSTRYWRQWHDSMMPPVSVHF